MNATWRIIQMNLSSEGNRIAVFGSGGCQPGSEEWNLAREAGVLLAGEGFITVTGGYGGVMEAVSYGAISAGGKAHAILHSPQRLLRQILMLPLSPWRRIIPDVWPVCCGFPSLSHCPGAWGRLRRLRLPSPCFTVITTGGSLCGAHSGTGNWRTFIRNSIWPKGNFPALPGCRIWSNSAPGSWIKNM